MLLKVHNFVCLKDVEIEIDDITFIIGEQASGKSLLCKLYFYFREVMSNLLVNSIIDNQGMDEYRKKCFDSFCDIFPVELWGEQSFSIQIIVNKKIAINLDYEKNKAAVFSTSDFLDDVFLVLKNDFHIEKEKYTNLDFNEISVFRNLVSKNDAEDIFEAITYIPSGRAFFAAIADNLFGLLSQNIAIDPFLRNFGKNYEIAKSAKLSQLPSEISNLMSFILKGDIFLEKKTAWLISQDVRRPLSYASSGQQEALPLLLVLRHLMDLSVLWGSHSVIIEEPEAHLFPSSQKAMVDLLFLIKNNSQCNNFIITTHSPYILSCANNALLKNTNIKVNAYYLANGYVKRIVDDETGLIDGIDLDKVSYEIAEEFDEILAGKYTND